MWGSDVESKHVRGDNAPKDVLRLAKPVPRVEERRQVPIQAVVEGQQTLDQSRRVLRAIVFDVEHGTMAVNGVLGSGHDFSFHAFDVNLHQVETGKVKVVDPQERNVFPLGPTG